MGLLGLLTAKGGDGSTTFADLLQAGAVDQEQSRAFDGVTGVEFASTQLLPVGAASGAAGKIVDVHGLANGTRIAAADTGHRDERRVPTVHAEVPTLDGDSGSTADPAILGREIRMRLGALRACDERVLKRSPELSGKLRLHIVVAPAGTVSTVELEQVSLDDAELESCIRGAVMHWRFSPLAGGKVEADIPLVFQAAR